MSEPPVPIPPRLLSLAVHEFRTPVTVIAGYLRMLLKDRAGPLSDAQRKLIEEAEKSCARLSTLLSEMSDLGQLEAGRQTLARQPLDLGEILSRAVAELDARPGEANVVLQGDPAPLPIVGDVVRLQRALDAVLASLRREIIDGSDLLVCRGTREAATGSVAWIAIGTPQVASSLLEARADDLGPFDEWRGGCGLALPLARRIIEMHGGRLLALTGERQKAGGAIELPLAPP